MMSINWNWSPISQFVSFLPQEAKRREREQKKKRTKLDLDKVEKIVRTIKVENGGAASAKRREEEEEPLVKIKREVDEEPPARVGTESLILFVTVPMIHTSNFPSSEAKATEAEEEDSVEL